MSGYRTGLESPAEAGAAVELLGVSARYSWDGPWVLRDVDVRVSAPSLVRVRGANGSGKSTLLRLLAGATLPTRGRRVAARPLAVGYAPDHLAPVPPFSAADFLRHHARLRGCSRTEGESRVRALADRLAVASLLSERLQALSSGSLRKVVLIQALLGDPRLLVLDEPFNGLDADAQSELVAILDECRTAGAAIVLSDHRALDAPVADVTWQLEGGAIGERKRTVPSSGVLSLPSLAGVLENEREGDRVRLLVATAESDRVLVALLKRGWHVESVVSAPPGHAVRIEARQRATQ